MKLLLIVCTVALTWAGAYGYDQLHLQECSYQDETQYCSRAAGLFCNPETSVCECLQGELDSNYKYTLEWDENLQRCAGAAGSACVGTSGSSGTPTVACKSGLVCNQIGGYVESVGVCAIASSTTAPPTGTPTTPAGASALQFSLGLVAILSLARVAFSL